ncbi:hypothetical protein H257_18606 [Aphanomyces astaci]|uniref:Chromo domain-containing protein n=1 Tax=Aphanomyces astaci TaxID=112090 RepID=W4FCR5_APHAT|nr:hypothetical protein H257_18606 [Aphanomyces astaci]ETV64513.1 hypothetical protein H257_18606 [Aphanomyces astaci]|eukprot:XP_009846003.1 hypothetical protein H257_18606 [Aphanomyces astaci]
MHRWDPQTTLSAGLPTTHTKGATANWRWRVRMQRQYLYAQGLTNDVIAEAQALRAEDLNSRLPEGRGERLQPGDEVWLFIDQVDAGVKKKLAHLWHGPFRIIKDISNYANQISRVSRRGGRTTGVAPITFDVEMILDDGDYDNAEDEPPDYPGLPDNPHNPVLPWNPGNVQEAPVLAVVAVSVANTSNPIAPKSITAIRDDRMIEYQTRPWQKQYEVQFDGSDQWVWVSEHAMAATPLLYEFERGRKNFDYWLRWFWEESFGWSQNCQGLMMKKSLLPQS